jgi:hypothetical protein
MFCRKTTFVAVALLVVVLGSTALPGQKRAAPPPSAAGLEFPVLMRQNVEAGSTPVGTKIQAKLTLATLVNGVVVPEGAILSGEVIESTAKSATEPSRLAVRMDSAEWKTQSKTQSKKQSAPTGLEFTSKVYLTAWFYQLERPMLEDFPDASQSNTAVRRHHSSYPDPNLTGGTTTDPPTAPSTSPTPHREMMKDVESTHGDDGVVTLTSKHSNIKLDKSTTYVLAVGGL